MSTAFDKQYNIRVRLTPEQRQKMELRAKAARRTLNAEVGIAVDRYLEQGSVFDPLPVEEDE